jgi:Putative peptidoglycan binding domain
VCGYIGGDTPHVWTADDWRSQTARYRLPIWVRSNPAAVNPAVDAAGCVAALRAIGAPKGTLVALDSETAIDAPWTRVFVRDVNYWGWPVIDYGSQSTVFGNDNPDGYYWGADWTSVPHLHSGDQMTQWADFGSIDKSLAEASLPFWDTHGGTPAPTTWQETMMQALPLVKQDATGPQVRTVQGLLLARGYSVTLDGVFGPATDATVKRFQGNSHLSADGIVGPQTWPALMDVS